MAGPGWEPLEPSGAGAPRRVERSRRRGGLLVVAVVVGTAVAGWTIAGPGGSNGDNGVPEDAMSEIRERTADGTTPTTLEENNANHAFAGAAQRLEQAGSFAFSGYVATNDPPTDVTPGRSVEGEVRVPNRSRLVSAGGPTEPVIETVVVGPTLVDLAITRIGDPIAIEPPAGKLPGVTDAVSPDEVHAAGLAEPVELARLPRGWMLTEIELLAGRAGGGCATLSLTYAMIDSPEWITIELTIMPATCAGEIVDRSLTAGEFSGEPRLAAGTGGLLTNGRTAVGFDSSLSMDETLTLLETLEPYDPSTRPTPL